MRESGRERERRREREREASRPFWGYQRRKEKAIEREKRERENGKAAVLVYRVVLASLLLLLSFLFGLKWFWLCNEERRLAAEAAAAAAAAVSRAVTHQGELRKEEREKKHKIM